MKKTTLKDFLIETIPENLIHTIPSSFEIVGDIAIVEIPEELKEFEINIGNSILKVNKSLKTVLKKTGIHEGKFRTQKLNYLVGENKKETIYKENGIKLKINPETVYFSARLSTERELLMSDLDDDKRVLVMFSGVGPYTFVALKKQPDLLRIDSVELNPEGHKYALENLNLNKNLVQKSDLYQNLTDFLRINEVPFYEKHFLENFNKLKIQFFNNDVKEYASKTFLRFQNCAPPSEDDNKLIITNDVKTIFKILKETSSKKLVFNFDTYKDYEDILPYVYLFADKFSFEIYLKSKLYTFNGFEQIKLLCNYLEKNISLSKIHLYDEIFMPLPKDAEHFLEHAFKLADKECVVHMYDFVHENDFPHKTETTIINAGKKFQREIEILNIRKVGQYSPRKYRVCCDFKILN